jgi:hypothetical protein
MIFSCSALGRQLGCDSKSSRKVLVVRRVEAISALLNIIRSAALRAFGSPEGLKDEACS